MKNILFIFTLLITFTACGDKKAVTDVLNRAEAVMNEHPDSALNLLRTLTFDDFQKEKNRARYALLHSQALDKNYIDVTSDSIISVAVDYYKNENEVRNKFLSYYYMGRVHANGERYLQATSCLMESEQLVEEVGDDYLSGLLYSEMGRIYRLYYDYPKSLEAHQKAAEYYERVGKIGHRNYMWFYQSTVCRNMNKYDEGERLLRKVLSSAQDEQDVDLVKSCMGNLVMLLVEQNRMVEAKELYEGELESLVDENYASSSFMGTLATMYASVGDFVKAESYLKRGWGRAMNHTDSISMYLCSSEFRDLSNNRYVAYQELLKGVSLQNNETQQALQQPILTAQRDYLSEKVAFEAYRHRMEKRQNLLSVLLLALLLIVSVYVFFRLLKKIQKKSLQVIHHLKMEKKQVEEEKDRISLLLEQLDLDKKEADLTITRLKNEVVQNKRRTHSEISSLVQDIELGKGSIEELKLKLQQNEESRLKMQALVQKLEADSKANVKTIDCLRAELRILQAENRKMMFQKIELLRTDLERMVRWVHLHENKILGAKRKEERIKEEISRLRQGYFSGEGEFKEVEKLVNLYLDDVMLHFRQEIELPNEADYRRVCYMFAGVSTPVIAEMMHESKEALYQRKSRLLKRITSGSCLHGDLYVLLLSK